MPDVALSYLANYFFEVGPAQAGGFGPTPLSFQELDAWARRVPRGLQPWEFIMLRRLSFEWIAESQRAEDATCPAPWAAAEVAPEERRRVADGLRAFLKRMAT